MPSSEFSHHYANLEGVRIHYVKMGQGSPVVLLHGWPQTWYEWRRVMPLLADKYALVAPDLRGHAPVRLLLSGLISHAEADRPMHAGDVLQLAGFWGDLLAR